MQIQESASDIASRLWVEAQAHPGCAVRWELAHRAGRAAEVVWALEDGDLSHHTRPPRAADWGPLSDLPDAAFTAYALARGGDALAPLCDALGVIQVEAAELAAQVARGVRASDADSPRVIE